MFSRHKNKATLNDVAVKAGVSRAAVSLTLRDHPKSRDFNPATIRRIKRVARELGYRPSFFSSQLRRGATQGSAQLLMVYLDTLQDLYAGGIAESIQLQAARLLDHDYGRAGLGR
ncbi:MAG: LacI family DNA-binding transcriptional regulator [Candidatus Pacebacteria bacterium]|nr:LacI family DNA-binding transcriptional regulator [Candidatus Paceibacterota bacterium]